MGRVARRVGILVGAFTDNRSRLWGTFVDGVRIVSPEEGLTRGWPIVISSKGDEVEMIREIESLCREKGWNMPPVIRPELFAQWFGGPAPMPASVNDGTNPEEFRLPGSIDILRATSHLEFRRVLDVGCGGGAAARYFARQGKSVLAIGLDLASYGIQSGQHAEGAEGVSYVEASLESFQTTERFDLIWMSHVLEHVQNVGLFLQTARKFLSEDGWLCVTVPPFRPDVVGGHVTNGWNTGQLMYNLLLAGYNIRDGHFAMHGYNVAGFVRKSLQPLPALRMDNGDLEATRDRWPFPPVQGFIGEISRVNWPWW